MLLTTVSVQVVHALMLFGDFGIVVLGILSHSTMLGIQSTSSGLDCQTSLYFSSQLLPAAIVMWCHYCCPKEQTELLEIQMETFLKKCVRQASSLPSIQSQT